MTVQANVARREGVVARFAVRAGDALAHPLFFLGAVVFHFGWVWLNVRAISPIEPFDPNPFPLLAMIASAEAPFIALLILMRQQRDARIAQLRDEVILQTALHAERETSKLLRMMEELQNGLGVASREHDDELEEMKQPIDPDRLLRDVEPEVEEED